MKATVTITVDVDDPETLNQVLQAANGTTPVMSFTTATLSSASEPATEPVQDLAAAAKAEADSLIAASRDEEEAAAEKRSAAAKKAAKTRAENKAKKDAEAELLGETPAGEAEAPKVTEGALKKAVTAAVKSKGIDGVREIFLKFKNKKGESCMKMSDVKVGDYAALVEALK